MMVYECVNKYPDYDGSIFQYVLRDKYGKIVNVDKDELKKAIRTGKVIVKNLKLTKDNRLIDKKYENFKVSRTGSEGTMTTYRKLLSESRWSESARQELADRIENIIYLDIVDDKNQRIGYIHTPEIESCLRNIEHFYNRIEVKESSTVLAEEVYYTCSIEGAKTTIKRTKQVMKDNKPKDYSEKMVYNSYRATKYLNIVAQGRLLTEKELFELWRILTKDACENMDIQGPRYRIGNVQVGTYFPPDTKVVEPLMKCFFEFMHKKDNLHVLVKAAILHFYFVFIHPFCDGNGRTTRMISTDYLIRMGLDKFKAISLSKEIHATVKSYELAFDNSENEYNDITFFIEYYLNMIQTTLTNIYYSVNP